MTIGTNFLDGDKVLYDTRLIQGPFSILDYLTIPIITPFNFYQIDLI